MSLSYEFPKQAAFGRMLPKSKIYNHSSPSAKLKDKFVTEVEKITWSFKLSYETINIPATDKIKEIQIFTVTQRTTTLSEDVLQAIDKAIPSPIVFICNFAEGTRYIACYKRQSEADYQKQVLSSYFSSEQFQPSTKKIALPLVLNLEALYEKLLFNIIPLPPRDREKLSNLVERYEELSRKEKEAARVAARMSNQKQFNRKVELNSELKALNHQIEDLQKQSTE